jgi:hypothetical protein
MNPVAPVTRTRPFVAMLYTSDVVQLVLGVCAQLPECQSRFKSRCTMFCRAPRVAFIPRCSSFLQEAYALNSMVDFDLGSRGTKLKAEQQKRLRDARKRLEQERRAKAAADAHAAEVQAQLKQKRLEQLRKEEEVLLIAKLLYSFVSMFYTKALGRSSILATCTYTYYSTHKQYAATNELHCCDADVHAFKVTCID